MTKEAGKAQRLMQLEERRQQREASREERMNDDFAGLEITDVTDTSFPPFTSQALQQQQDNRQQQADSRQQTQDARQQAADSGQQPANSRQEPEDARQQTACQGFESVGYCDGVPTTCPYTHTALPLPLTPEVCVSVSVCHLLYAVYPLLSIVSCLP
jgi:hypothetical protein